jgi:tripartite-type tricarboxylate transporter receptor subunit TctC
MRKHWLSTLIGIIGMAFALAVTPASAQSVEDFYKGKTVTVFVGYSAGGGYDTYARTVARHIGKHIPGNPSVIVKNRAGAGSMLLTNELYNILPKDGTVIGIIGRGLPMEPLFGTPEAKYDPSKFTWLGSSNNEVSVCVSWHTSPVKKWEDLLTTPLIVGGTGPGADTDTFPRIMNNLLGTKLKLVTGYPGGNDVLLAMERGEVEGRCGYSWSSAKARKADWLAEGKLNILVQMSTGKHEDLPDVPLIMDLAKTQADKDALELIYARQEFGRPFLAPPGVPADRAEALQTAFMETMKDPEFLEDAKKQDLEINPVSGKRVGELIAKIYRAPKEVVMLAREASEKEGTLDVSAAKVELMKISGAVTKIEEGGRTIHLGDKSAAISGSRTELTIDGKPGDRANVKMGMMCEAELTGDNGSEAKTFSCK